MPVATPDFSSRPIRLGAGRAMEVQPEIVFRAWTEQMDRWFAAPGSVLMTPAVNTVFFWETDFEGKTTPARRKNEGPRLSAVARTEDER